MSVILLPNVEPLCSADVLVLLCFMSVLLILRVCKPEASKICVGCISVSATLCCGTQGSILYRGSPGFESQPSDLQNVVAAFCAHLRITVVHVSPI